MSAAASSLALASLAPKTLSLFSPKPALLSLRSLSPSSLKLNVNLVCVPAKGFRNLPSRFVRNVAISSEFDQDEEVSSDGGERNFAPDLKLFVGNLPFNCDSAQLAGLFERAGNVEMVEVIYDKTTGRSRGFGFVTMSSMDEVEAAAQQFNGYELDGRALRVNFGPPPARDDSFPRGGRGGGGGGGGRDDGNRIYVGNLPWSADNSTLHDLFSEQGQVVDAKVVFDRESGRSRGFGFVTYNSADEVNNAIESLNGIDLDGRQIRVTRAEARPSRSF
ncbi:RNA-binding protein CP29B, chloroplastic [Cannabis sativa]|uniref:RRM domain-containing protein n=1 Tax=Cannabis sativa TaxID=3483 RepID=A0A7J6GGT0_CANSA|nr:RNA-binding protein CP29B, chloroplastic [Cannabis sativa]XP_060967775.1 RNA-binding protein CP29B, chloroplastic [Cannabis sativa]XP_060967776.1 RNA-binding protein CP29B, chloroplastic [Cannabis sativa]KAF4382171.1 hypothetical protein F8388_008657 [Cannabis sativa]